MAQLNVELNDNNDEGWTLTLVGTVDSDTRHLMWSFEDSAALLAELINAGAKKLLIDLTLAERFDSHGLRLLLNAQKEFSKESIQIVLRNPNSHLTRLFQIMQFDKVFVVEFDD